jgi:hypothetical protein
MNAKHQFKYTYNETSLEEFSPVEVTFEVPGDVNLAQMLYNFQCYLRACGFVFDGSLEIVSEESYDAIDDTSYCCMGDSDNCNEEHKDVDKKMWDKIAENVKQKWVHGMCNPPSPDWKKSDSDNCWNS